MFPFQADIKVGTIDVADQKSKLLDLERQLLMTGLCQTMQELVSNYILLEDHFMSTNVRKALEQHQSDMAAQQVANQALKLPINNL